MATNIEWADEVWNPVTGCTSVSPGCDHCYARVMARRLAGRCGYPRDNPFRPTPHPGRLERPSRWRRPRRVFVNSMGDLWHGDVDFEYIAAIWATMALNPHHTFLVLTKRPEIALAWFEWLRETAPQPEPRFLPTPPVAGAARPPGVPSTQRYADEHQRCLWQGFLNGAPARDWPTLARRLRAPWPLQNVWLGVTAENQALADLRIPLLLQLPAASRFVSCEPLLGPIELEHWLRPRWGEVRNGLKPFEPEVLDWVIVGGETGPRARPMDVAWARSLLDQSRRGAAAYFFKRIAKGVETPSDLAVRQFPSSERLGKGG